jgi:hypothetical protein
LVAVSSLPHKELSEITKAWDSLVGAAWGCIEHILLSREKKAKIASAGKNLDDEIAKASTRFQALLHKPLPRSDISLDICRKVFEPLECLAEFLKLEDGTFTRRLLTTMQQGFSSNGTSSGAGKASVGAVVNGRKKERAARDAKQRNETTSESSSSSAGGAGVKAGAAGDPKSADESSGQGKYDACG